VSPDAWPPVPPPKTPFLSTLEILLIAGIVIGVAVLIGLFTIPVAASFSGQLEVPAGIGTIANYTFPTGSYVSGNWWTTSQTEADFFIWDTVYGHPSLVHFSSYAYYGSFSFTVGYNPYQFAASSLPFGPNVTVDFAGNYSAPLL